MDYEKKYRDLVEAVKELQEANPSDEGIQKWVEDNVPELKESEGERIIGIIRSTLESYNRGIIFDSLNTKDYADCLAWLEKQAQKPAELGENRSKELSLSLQIQAYLNTASDELYAKGKPLYFEKRIEDIHKCMLMWQKLHNAYFYHNFVEWSEEDERNLQGIIDEIEANKNHAPDYDVATHDRFLSWLKDLKDRVQSQWKPSDEQMDAMQKAVFYFGNSWVSDEQKALTSLFSELKKLKGE